MTTHRPLLRAILLACALLISPARAERVERGQDGEANPSLSVKGSDTLVKVARAWKRGFREHQVALRRQKGPVRVQGESIVLPPPLTNVVVDGGGSGNGIAALINDHVDIATSSRPIREQELRVLARRTNTKPVARIVGYDAVVMVVAHNNPINSLFLGQLTGIYGAGGLLRTWDQAGVTVPGCPSQKILFFSRKNNSGTYAIFQDVILDRSGRFHPEMVSLEATSQIVDRVAVSPCAIGYTGLAYVDARVKPLCLATAPGQPCISASELSVRNHAYPLSRPLFMYTLGEPKGVVKEFMDWVTGPEGQRIMQDEGYITLLKEQESASGGQ